MCYHVLSGLAAAQLHSMPPILCYPFQETWNISGKMCIGSLTTYTSGITEIHGVKSIQRNRSGKNTLISMQWRVNRPLCGWVDCWGGGREWGLKERELLHSCVCMHTIIFVPYSSRRIERNCWAISTAWPMHAWGSSKSIYRRNTCTIHEKKKKKKDNGTTL